MTSQKPTTPPTRPRLTTPAEADEMCGRAFAEAARELREEDERKKESAPPRSDYELDDVPSRVLIRTWEEALARDETKRKKGEKPE